MAFEKGVWAVRTLYIKSGDYAVSGCLWALSIVQIGHFWKVSCGTAQAALAAECLGELGVADDARALEEEEDDEEDAPLDAFLERKLLAARERDRRPKGPLEV